MLNTIFIVWLFRIEGAGNLHLPVAKINLYYGDKGEKGGIVRTTMMETVFIMSTMILLNSIFTVWLFWSEGAGNLSSLFWVMVKSQQKAVVKLSNACGLGERILHVVMWEMGHSDRREHHKPGGWKSHPLTLVCTFSMSTFLKISKGWCGLTNGIQFINKFKWQEIFSVVGDALICHH